MKKIEAIIRPEKPGAVRDALEGLGYPGMTFSEAKGHGAHKGLTQQWRGQERKVDFLPEVKLELAISDRELEAIISAIVENGRTSETGDGNIFVWPIENAIRIRTSGQGQAAA